MFESYALFPHITILDNVCYSHHLYYENREENHKFGRELLNLVKIKNRDQSLPKQCSGGMQQRVALARSLMALESSGLLILDEPFKALDAGLRINLRKEVRDIVKSKDLGITCIHITNDMQEAMMADKIVVLNKGKIEQIDSPFQIMYNPKNFFIANFFSTELNYFNGRIIKIEKVETDKRILYPKEINLWKVIILTEEGFILYAKTPKVFNLEEKVTFLIRSQYFKARHKRREEKTNCIFGIVTRTKYMGPWMRIEIAAPSKPETLNCIQRNKDTNEVEICSQDVTVKQLKIEVPTTRDAIHNFRVGEIITVYFPSEYVIVFQQIEKEKIESFLKVK